MLRSASLSVRLACLARTIALASSGVRLRRLALPPATASGLLNCVLQAGQIMFVGFKRAYTTTGYASSAYVARQYGIRAIPPRLINSQK